MKKWLVISIVLLGLVTGIPSAMAMRCGTKLINEDSTKFDVLQACGEPMKKFGEDIEIGKEGVTTGGYEKWIYDIGGGVYHIVTFHGDQVWKIEIENK